MSDIEQMEGELKKKMDLKSFLKGMLLGSMISVTLVLLGIISFLFVVNVIRPTSAADRSAAEVLTSKETLDKIEMITNTINQYYIEDVDAQTLQEGIYRGLVDVLEDPYSVYYTEEELTELLESTEGIYYGIGAYISLPTDTNMPTIARVIEGSPAMESRLLAGDVILEVDGVDIRGYELEDVTALVKGPEGTTVVLSIYREGSKEELDITIERRKIETDTVTYEMKEDKIAYISISQFDHVTVDQFREALVVAEGNGMQGLIFDLRGNPGGNVDTVVKMMRMILPEGLIVYTEDKYGNRVEYTGEGDEGIDVPLAVLIDGASASAAEIMAGGIRDYGIGTLIGTTTFGKGVVQNIITLSDGTALKITSSQYYTPNGEDIHGAGIAPDLEVPFDAKSYVEEGIDNQLEAAIEYLHTQMN